MENRHPPPHNIKVILIINKNKSKPNKMAAQRTHVDKFIIGLRKDIAKNTQEVIKGFYSEILPKYKSVKKMTVYEAIGDLPACLPLIDTPHKRASHNTPPSSTTWHQPRFHSERDQSIFELLAADLASGECKYTCSKVISNLYAERVGSHSPIHRYHVLRPNEPSTTIIAHLYKDGNRYIHYDPKQRRTITPREAARLQSFADDFDFVGSRGDVYQMIGNAVPPVFAKNIALAVRDLLDELLEEK
jgi:DNA (cytosine-5)-methyltransferase 1